MTRRNSTAPSTLGAIVRQRPPGPRVLRERIGPQEYLSRLEGALLGRFAGCTLGAPVEGWPIARMAALARENGQAFPPTEYWKRVPDPAVLRYGRSRREEYTVSKMRGVPVDDDTAYTVLGLLIAEQYGPDFTTGDVAAAWLAMLPIACTAEKVALDNLRAGISPLRAADVNNPYDQWIGAAIRADAWGYLAAGRPQLAAELAHRDAYLSHRSEGLYGEMFWAAAIAAAFAVDDPLEAVRVGLTEIPRGCRLAVAVRWALRESPRIRSYRSARSAVNRRFPKMHPVDTINNACLTVFGIAIGKGDLTGTLAHTVAMGLDNDCTAATAGSLVGAVVGRGGVPQRWTRPFGDTVHTYLHRRPHLKISSLAKRFARQRRRFI